MKSLQLGKRVLDLSEPVVMGILNVTPDSFYDGGCYQSEVEITARIHRIMEDGAGIIDVGAYSTRPGAAAVNEKEEIARLMPAVELIRRHYPDAVISVDTFRAAVAEEVNTCMGPVIINDISGGTMDVGMFRWVARSGVPYVMMHIQGTPQNMQKNPVYTDVVGEVREFFEERIRLFREEGFSNIILDPGFGFGKTVAHNYELLSNLETFRESGFPLLVGMSRKSMVCRVVDTNPEGALNGTTVLNTVALMKGADILRVHDVKEAVEAVRIVGKMKEGK